MKVFISADIEGITGVVHWDETTLQSPFQKQMTREVSAACEGVNRAGAKEILIKDAHSTARNIDPNGLPVNAKLLKGWSMGPLGMMEGIDESFDAALMVGYHSGASVEGNPLAHTYSNSKFQYIKLNGQLMSEFQLNTLTAHYFGVPVIFISGDKALCQLAEETYKHIHTVDTMEAQGDAMICNHPEVSIERIIDMTEACMKQALKSIDTTLPEHFSFEIQYKEAKFAHRGSFYPGVSKKDAKTVTFETDDYMTFLKMFMFLKI